MKKSVMIVIGIGVALAIALIGIFGVSPLFVNQKVFVESVVINDKNDQGIIYVDYDNQNTVDLTVTVLPYEATDKKLIFSSNDENVVVVANSVTTATVTLN